jgi:LPS export ABC transporter protein LptC/lipopolysaccharide transport protein LptA
VRLERIFTHRLVRTLQLLLPILVLALVAIPTWNYFAKLSQKSTPSRDAKHLPAGVSVHAEGYTFSQTEGGRTSYTVRAKTYLGDKDKKSMLEDVDVTVYGATEKDPTRTIRGKHCTYDQDTSDFECNGDVQIELDERTTIRTDELLYNHTGGIATAPHRAFLDREGTSGQADRFEYGVTSGVLKMDGNVKIETEEHTVLQSDSVIFQQKENWTTMSGNVYIKSPTSWIRGTTGRAELQSGSFKPKSITIAGAVTGESHPVPGNDTWKIRSDTFDATISPAGYAEHVKTRGNAEVEKIAGDMRQRLTGAEIDAAMSEGKIDMIQAHQNARMVMGEDQTLESSEIWTDRNGSIRTVDKSTLKVGDSTIEGRDFTMENGEDVVIFSTDRHATLKKGDEQESSADQTNARFDNRTNMLIDLVQRGNFVFQTPQYQGRAKSGKFEDGGNLVTLTGSPIVNDSQKQLQAETIQLNQKDNSFIATKNVTTLMKNSDERVLVKAAKAEGGSDSMLYTGGVQLWRGDTYVKAERLTASGDQQNSKVHAESPGGGRVQSNLQNVGAKSDSLDYDQAGGTIHYTGNVQAKKQDMIVVAPEMTVHFRDNNVTDMTASGGVKVTREDQIGTGELAVYEAATDVVTLTGKDAQVRDPQGLAQGPSVTMRNKGRNVVIQGATGARTTTQHPVKK